MKKLNKIAIVTLYAAALLLPLSGCGSKAPSTPATGIGAQAGTGEEEGTGEPGEAGDQEGSGNSMESGNKSASGDDFAGNEMSSELYNSYVGVYNMITGEVEQAVQEYFSHVPFSEQFLAPEGSDYGVYPVSVSSMRLLETTKHLAEEKAEESDLERVYLELYPVMKDLAGAINEVAGYADKKEYLEDNYKKGEQLHTRIYEGYLQYGALSEEFLAAADPVFEEVSLRDMERMKEDGLEMSYAANVVMTTAMEIQEVIYEQGITDNYLLELDTGALQPLYERYAAEIETCLSVYQDPVKMEKEPYFSDNLYMEQFMGYMKDTKTALDNLFKRVEEKRPVSGPELNATAAADGTIAKFDEAVSDMVDSYNMTVVR